jgi:hypothetical protein
MNPGRITAWSAGAVLALGLAACGGSTSGGSAAPVGTSGLTSGLTPPGTQLTLGQTATVVTTAGQQQESVTFFGTC